MTEEQKEKNNRKNGCIAGIIMILIAIVVCFYVSLEQNPPYHVRVSKVGSNNNANIEIVIANTTSDVDMQKIAMTEAAKHESQRHIFVFFYTKDKYDCFATSHSKDNYQVKRLHQGR